MQRVFVALRGLALVCAVALTGSVADAEDNAAPIYLRACEMMTEADLARLRAIREGEHAGLIDEGTREWLDGLADVIRLLREAGQRSECDFGVDLRATGLRTPLAHIRPMRESATLLHSSARAHLEKGDADSATSDVIAAYKISRHLSNDGVLLSCAVSAWITQETTRLVRSFHDDGLLDAEHRRRIVEETDFLQAISVIKDFGLWKAVRVEGGSIAAWFEDELSERTADERRTFLAELLGDDLENEGVRERLETLADMVSTIGGVRSESEGFRRLHEDMLGVRVPDDIKATEKGLIEIRERLERGEYGTLAMLFCPQVRTLHARCVRSTLDFLRMIKEFEDAGDV